MLNTYLKCLLRNNSGATAVEYGLILALIVIAMMGALSAFATENANMWDFIREETTNAITAAR